MRLQSLLAFSLLFVAVCFPLTLGQQPPMVSLRPGLSASDANVPVVNVIVDRHRVPLGTEVTFTLSPASVINSPLYAVTLNYGDGGRQVVKSTEIVHLYRAVGTYTYSVYVKANGRKPEPPDNDPTKQIPRVTLHATPVQIEEGNRVSFRAQLSQPYPNIQFRFVYGDGSSTGWQVSPQAQQSYQNAGSYFAYVDIGVNNQPIGGSQKKTIDVKKGGSLSVYITADPQPAQMGQPVLFTARLSSVRPNTRYRFAFGDGSQLSRWQTSSQATHTYNKPGSYHAYVEVAQSDSGRNLNATSSPMAVNVQRSLAPTPTPGPGPTPRPTPSPSPDVSPSPTPFGGTSPSPNPSSSADTQNKSDGPTLVTTVTVTSTPGESSPSNRNGLSWNWWYVIIAALLLFLLYKATGYLFAARPSFAAFSDPGVAGVADRTGGVPLDFQLLLKPNVSTGEYTVHTESPRLVTNADRLEDRQVLEI
jgi:hypothetical protein